MEFHRKYYKLKKYLWKTELELQRIDVDTEQEYLNQYRKGFNIW
jgi:hypothetical protein